MSEKKEKTVLLNIDSSYRERIPKNILLGKNIYPTNLILKKDSNILKINFKNNFIKSGDKIIIKNVKARSESISQALYFINNYDYALIYLPNHGFTKNFEKYYSPNKIEISNIDYDESLISNIPINSLLTKHQIYLIENLILPEKFLDNVNLDYDQLKNNFIGIKLIKQYISFNDYDILPNLIDINCTEYGGIPIGYFNADFPVSFNQRQGNYLVSNHTPSSLEVILPIKSYKDETIIGNILIDKIESEYEGYPEISDYTIKLRKHLTNVSRIELISTEIPNNLNNISSNNNRFYWQNLDDGKIEYEVIIPEGNYTIENLVNKLQSLINLTPRQTNKSIEIFNLFEIELDKSSQEIIFKSYKEDNLSNAIFLKTSVIDNQERNVLEIVHKNNNVQVGDIITISNSTAIRYIPANIINGKHTVISVNKLNDSYQVILPSFDQTEISGTQLAVASTSGTIGVDTVDTKTDIATDINLDVRSAYPSQGAGGEEIKVISRNFSRLIFTKSNTLGNILGFRDSGLSNAITNFSSVISNKDEYSNEDGFSLNVVGNERNSNNYFNLTSDVKYIFMYINDYEEIVTNTTARDCFAKILVDTKDGLNLQGSALEYMVNTFVSYPIEFNPPIPNLSQLQIKFSFPDGSLVNFGNVEHSLTLKITEDNYKSDNINSNLINIYEKNI